ncbi:hypothetical protein [Pedobacter sp. ASV28]|uniref:hypothetical protein n=1 Tax=Pedobacter sp. ASV28 TaxID=2795123 RepID=UPI0018EB99D9|nr:hypothetical protein [Pedobacter sp. ASV28]
MRRLFLSLGLLGIALTTLSAGSKKTVQSECHEYFRIINRYGCGDVLVDQFLIWSNNNPTSCYVTTDQITVIGDPIPICYHLHPPGGRY